MQINIEHEKNKMIVFQKHGKEIELYQKQFGKTRGLVVYASAILSDVLEMETDGEISEEIREVKELLWLIHRQLENLIKEV